jgi:hypothetical protein
LFEGKSNSKYHLRTCLSQMEQFNIQNSSQRTLPHDFFQIWANLIGKPSEVVP